MSLPARRDRQPEVMDDPALDPAAHRRALAGLARINHWSGSAGVLWPAVRDLARPLHRPLRILDVATGSGDVPLELWRRATRAGLPLDITGLDLSPIAIDAARSSASADIRFAVADVMNDPLPGGFDVVTCSLFLHHLDEPDAVNLLAKMSAAGSMVLVNDLERSRLNYGLVWLAARLFSRSPVVHTDGPLSVRGAFTAPEMRRLAEQAGLTGATVQTKFPCRLLLTWRSPT
jgi:2-polyprenyl-3-methyl-5-hydroxy-6-metoxy-1,4-benzoquinol methylase